jgi:capsular exopolysaccharide synthesis family protein
MHAESFSEQEREYARLNRELEINKKLYVMFKEKLEELRIIESQKVSDVSIIDPALMPKPIKVGDTAKRNLLAGPALGLVLGFTLAFILEALDTSITSIEDVENVVKLPVLGVIPSITPRHKKEERNIFKKFKQKIKPLEKDSAQEAYVRLIVHHEPTSYVAEAFRNIRTNLKLDAAKKAILVTSAGPREGKTTIATNLALVLAQKGAKTLLVSSDLRRPVTAKAFGIEREPGLYEVISGNLKIEDALRNISDMILGDMSLDEIVKFPGIENLWILPSGHLSSNPTAILESPEMIKLIKELKEGFDALFFDSPPVLPITDASLLAPKLDSVVLCYEIGRTSRDALLRAKVQLESVGAKISGVILNHITPRGEIILPYPYYYYRYKYRYYGREEQEKEQKA